MNMHLALTQIGVVLAAVCITAILIWLKGVSGASSLLLLGIALSFGKEIGKLEEKARLLNCTNRQLDRRYQEIPKIWRKNALPNF